MKRKTSRLRCGLSLVELLVVVTIITILVALLFPAGSSMMQGARKSACASNLRQVGGAQAAYSADHGGDIVPQYDSARQTITDNLAPYLGGMKDSYIGPDVMYCPENEVHMSPPKRGFQVVPDFYNKGFSGYLIGYTINASLHKFLPPDVEGNPVKLAQLASPARTVSLFDFMYATNLSYSSAPPSLTLTDSRQFDPTTSVFFLGGPHKGVGNVLFCDGHVESFSTNAKASVMSYVGQTQPW